MEEVVLTPNAILDKKFTKDVKGYNPDEVDEFLDCIIKDYMKFIEYIEKAESYQKSLNDRILALEADNSRLVEDANKKIEQIRNLESVNASLSDRMSHISSSDHVTEENLDYINKINIYEEYLMMKGAVPARVIQFMKEKKKNDQ